MCDLQWREPALDACSAFGPAQEFVNLKGWLQLFSAEMESWLALQVAPQHENKVATILDYKGFEQFFPTYNSKRHWSDRVKIIMRPLFPGYIFCRSPRSKTAAILATPGVNRIVSFGGKPCVIPDEEIARLHSIVKAGMDPRPFPYLNTGQRVRIIRDGVLFGMVGILTKIKNRSRLVVSVDMIAKSISIEVDYQDVASEDKYGSVECNQRMLVT